MEQNGNPAEPRECSSRYIAAMPDRVLEVWNANFTDEQPTKNAARHRLVEWRWCGGASRSASAPTSWALVDGEIVVEDARPRKVDGCHPTRRRRRDPRALDAGTRRLDTRRSQARDAAPDHNPVPKRICASWFKAPRCLNGTPSMARAYRWEEHSLKSGLFLFFMSCLEPTGVL
jgi:hypothetical protein